jgi:hypothetical protein
VRDTVPSQPPTITVAVDGHPVTFSSTGGWTYDADRSAILLWGTAIPAAGAQIVVRYPFDASCGI